VRPIYLDFNASTPLAPSVAEGMRAGLEAGYGNPSSAHWAAAPARAALEKARAQVAALLRCSPAEIVFTSGGSESNNLALKAG
jgi:cysteine desulfurase